jgi:hypothetical protein
VTLDLVPTGGGTTELFPRHAVGDDDHWATYGPGAVGVGWDLTLLGLAQHLRTGAAVDDPQGLVTSPEGRAFMRSSAADWGAAHAAAGAQAANTKEAAARTSAAYAPGPDRAPS